MTTKPETDWPRGAMEHGRARGAPEGGDAADHRAHRRVRAGGVPQPARKLKASLANPAIRRSLSHC